MGEAEAADWALGEARAKLAGAFAALRQSGLEATRVLLSGAAYRALLAAGEIEHHYCGPVLVVPAETATGRAVPRQIRVTVTSANPAAVFATAYHEAG